MLASRLSEPGHSLAGDADRHDVRAGKLVIDDVIAAVTQKWDETLAASHRQDAIVSTVGDEDARAFFLRSECHEARRECYGVAEEVAVGEAEGQRVGRTIGKSSDREVRPIDGVTTEYAV